MTLDEKRQKAEEIIDAPIEWDDDRGYFECPLSYLHTTKTGRRDTMVYLTGVPTSYCWHQHCQEWHENINQVLRKELDDRTSKEKREDKERRLDRRDALYKVVRIKNELEEIYEKYDWPDLKPTR